MRITTGAPTPEGADTVVRFEDTQLSGDAVSILKAPRAGANVRQATVDHLLRPSTGSTGYLLWLHDRRRQVSEDRNAAAEKHTHGGKSSESLLDKAQILASLSITPGQVILDAGCGNGYMAKEFAELTGEAGVVYALDPHAPSIETLKSVTVGKNIRAFVGKISEETKLPSSSIDLIYVSTVLHGFSESAMDGFRREVARLLKPGGRLAVVEIKKEETPFGPPLDIRFSPEELEQATGLDPVRLVDVAEHFYMQVFAA
jgi:SAM-dependent methyltransferase